MNANSPCHGVEIEAKFLGAKEEFERVVGWLDGEGFATNRTQPLNRVHVYFDNDDTLRDAGCRLRCVIAPGEWCRYDFKADDPTEKRETVEVSLRRTAPIPIAHAIDELAERLPRGAFRDRLMGVKDAIRIILVMTGNHHKAAAHRAGLELEVSWDVFTPLVTGQALSEVELEFLSGNRESFDALIAKIQPALGLNAITMNKLTRALGD